MKTRRIVFIAVMDLLLCLPMSGKAAPYTFTRIADTNGDFSFFPDSVVPMNNKGVVPFWGTLKSGENGIFVGDGNAIPMMILPEGSIVAANEPRGINDSGTVLFQGLLSTGVRGILTYNYISEEIATIAEETATIGSSDFFSGFDGRSINNDGTVAFRAKQNIPNREGIFIGNGGPTTTIATKNGNPITGFSGDPVINETGEVVFIGGTTQGFRVFTSKKSGDLTDIIAGMSQPFSVFSEPDINDDGTIIFGGENIQVGGENIQGKGLFIYKAGGTMPIVDDSGPFSRFEAFLAINNDETVVFRAFLDIGEMGIFTGPDPLADRVIATGDPLFGSTVADLFFFREGLNDAGQIAFWARLADGTTGIYRADPIPILEQPPDLYQVDLTLVKGINILSLPLRPETQITASQLAADIGATLVIRAVKGKFHVYISDGNFGIDFPIEVGKGYIVNLLQATTYRVTGQPWGTPIDAAPAMPDGGTWAFVVAGFLPDGRETAITARHSASNRVVEGYAANGRFVIPFVDMNRRDTITPGDTLEIEVDSETIIQHQVTPDDITHAYAVVTVPRRFVLYHNYPNPFNPETWLPYQLASDAEVTIGIYDISGRLVRQLGLGRKPAGLYLSRDQAAYWDGRSETGELVSSGVYFYRLQAGDFTATKRMVVVK